MHLRRPFRQQVGTALQQYPAERRQRRVPRRLRQQGARDRVCALVGQQRGTHRIEIVVNRGDRLGHVACAKPLRDLRRLGKIKILRRHREIRIAIAQIGGKEAAHLGHVHPGQQDGIIGRITCAIRQHALNMVVDRAHPRDQSLGLLGRTVGGAGDELSGTPQTSQHVRAEVAMIPYSGERARVEHLHQQGRDPAHHHRGEIGMDLPRRRLRPEQARVATIEIDLTRSETDHLVDMALECAPETYHALATTGGPSGSAADDPIAIPARWSRRCWSSSISKPPRSRAIPIRSKSHGSSSRANPNPT